MAATSYSNLRKEGNLIIDIANKKKYSDNAALATDLGITPDKINWAAIADQKVGTFDNIQSKPAPAAPIAPIAPVPAPIAPTPPGTPNGTNNAPAPVKDTTHVDISNKNGQKMVIQAWELPTYQSQGWAKTITDPSQANSLDDVKSFINSDQEADAASQNSKDEIPVRKTVEDYMAEIKDAGSALSEGEKKPEAPNYETKFTDLRTQYGVGELETKLNDLNAQLDAADAEYIANKASIQSEPEAMNVINGRIGEENQKYKDKVDYITRQKNTVINELNTKYSVIDSIMKYSKMTYDDAAGAYDKNFSQNLQAINLIQGIDETNQSLEEKAKSNAQANLNTIYNLITSSGISLSALSDDQKTLITKNELIAGLPVGFYKNLQEKNPKSDVIATNNWTDAGGKEYIAVITKDKGTGKIQTENIYIGQGKQPSSSSVEKPTESDVKLYYKSYMAAELKKVQGPDGHVSPSDWSRARKAWTDNTPYSGSDFDDNFRSYINPTHPADYEGFERYNENFQPKNKNE